MQFTAVPWLRDHLFAQVTALADTVDPGGMLEDGVKRISEALRGGGSGSLLDALELARAEARSSTGSPA